MTNGCGRLQLRKRMVSIKVSRFSIFWLLKENGIRIVVEACEEAPGVDAGTHLMKQHP